MNKKFDIDEKINLIYNYLYNNNFKSCFEIENINKSKIKLDDVKVSNGQYSDEILDEILSGKFIMTGSNNNDLLTYFKRFSDQFSLLLKVGPNPVESNYFDSHSINDSLFSYLLSPLVLNKKTIHILLPIVNIDVPFKKIEHIMKITPLYDEMKDKINSNEISDIVSLRIREHFFKTMNLEEYLKENTCSHKILLFQVIHTLAILQDAFPGFRHNNLKPENILIYLKRESEIDNEYTFKNKKYYVKPENFDIKLTNFEHSVIPEQFGEFNYSDKTIPFIREKNNYFDLHYFLNNLLQISLKQNENKCDKETLDFLDKVIPVEYRGINKLNLYLKKNIELFDPKDLLDDEYFDEFRKDKKDIIKSEDRLFNTEYMLGSKTKMDSNYSEIFGKQENLTFNNTMSKTKYFRKLNTELENDKKKFTRQIGGFKQSVPPFRTEKNTPFLTNDARETFKKRQLDAPPPPKEQPVLLEQKIYDTQKPAPKQQQFPPMFVPIYDPQGNITQNLLPYSSVQNQPPIQKVYNISLPGPTGDHVRINAIYEDMLPGKEYSYTYNSLFERKALIDFTRNSLLEREDGEMSTFGGGKNSLLSYLKLVEINPYGVDKNPYKNLPKGFIIYRAAYPIRYDETRNLISISKISTGVNVRIYKMTIGDVKANEINSNINKESFDLWREVRYYEYIREELLKKKISPNFISSILYKIDTESKIEWSKMQNITDANRPISLRDIQVKNEQNINKLHDFSNPEGVRRYIESFTSTRKLIPSQPIQPIQQIPTTGVDLTADSMKSLVLLTEAGNSNIITWASPIYESQGTLNKMISTGYHTPEIWKNILFQVVYAFAVMQEKRFKFQDFKLENILIKDLFADVNNLGHWIYQVDNINFYVPNMGFLVMVDSKYSDITKPYDVDNRIFKIVGPMFQNNGVESLDSVKQSILEQFKECINPEKFTSEFKIRGGNIPDTEILKLLQAIYDDSSVNIKEYLIKHFKNFVHNRVGSLLMISEKEKLDTLSRPVFKKGNLLVYQERYMEYKWVLDCGPIADQPMRRRVLTKNNSGNFEILDVFTNALYTYPETEKIVLDATQTVKLDTEHLIEKYLLE